MKRSDVEKLVEECGGCLADCPCRQCKLVGALQFLLEQTRWRKCSEELPPENEIVHVAGGLAIWTGHAWHTCLEREWPTIQWPVTHGGLRNQIEQFTRRTPGAGEVKLPDDPEPGCGYGVFKTDEDDPLLRACTTHDARYGQHETGTEYDKYSQARADKEFLRNCLRLAGDSKLLKARAYIYYGIVRSAGWLLW